MQPASSQFGMKRGARALAGAFGWTAALLRSILALGNGIVAGKILFTEWQCKLVRLTRNVLNLYIVGQDGNLSPDNQS